MPCYKSNNIIYPDFDPYEGAELMGEAYEWLEEMYEASRAVIDELNCDALSAVDKYASTIMGSVQEGDNAKQIDSCDNIDTVIRKAFDEDANLERIYVDRGVSNAIVNDKIGNKHYIHTFKVYVRGHRDPYLLNIFAKVIFDEYVHCGYPYTEFDVEIVRLRRNEDIHTRAQWEEILGDQADYGPDFFDDMFEGYGYSRIYT